MGIMTHGEHSGEHGYQSYWHTDSGYSPQWVPADHEYLPVEHVNPCWRCHGEGRCDYGSKAITTPWGGVGTIHLDATGKVLDGSGGQYVKTPKHTDAWPPGTAKYEAPPTQPTIESQLRAVFPALAVIARCPACESTRVDVGNLVIHLNDKHSWTREAIADHLESTDIDLTFHDPKGVSVKEKFTYFEATTVENAGMLTKADMIAFIKKIEGKEA
jgi:hypothetical protein